MKNVFMLALTAVVIGAMFSDAPSRVSASINAAPVNTQPLRGGGGCNNPIPRPTFSGPFFRPNIAAAVISTGAIHNDTKTQVTAYQPDNSGPAIINRRASSISSTGFIAMSSDGRLETWYGVSSPTASTLLLDAIGEGSCTNIAVPQGYAAVDAAFLNDVTGLPHYLAYVLVDGAQNTWILGIWDVYTRQYVELSDAYQLVNGKTPTVGFKGIANVLGWQPTSKTLILSVYAPFADGQAYNSIYALDIARLPLNSQRRAFPAAKLLIPLEKGLGVTLSPDGTKLAYLHSDPNNQPTGYQPFAGPGGGGPVPSGLTVIDSASGKTITTYEATQAQGFGTYSWTLDSQHMIFTTGAFQQTDYPTLPIVNTLDVASGKVTPGLGLTTDPTARVRAIQLCDGALFYLVDHPNATNNQPTLYSGFLGDRNNHHSAAITAPYITMVNCIPG